jgi:hypothetical protein
MRAEIKIERLQGREIVEADNRLRFKIVGSRVCAGISISDGADIDQFSVAR